MRTTLVLSLSIVAASAQSAAAWDGGRNWWDDPAGANPGGGGVFGTGGQHDHGIKCEDCHTDNPTGTFEARFQFTPAMAEAAGQFIYEPGQRYQVDVSMVGEVIVPTCDPYMEHNNNFAATFEDEDGANSGVLETDSGRIQTSCPPEWPMTAPAGTTGIYRDCEVVFAYGPDRTTWRFWWTAPAAGAGTISMFYGMVDGDCMMNSLGDVVVTGERVMREPSAAAAASPGPERPGTATGLAALAMLPLALVLWRRRRSLALLALLVVVACGGDPAGAGADASPSDSAATTDSSSTVDAGPQLTDVVCDDFERATFGSDWIAGAGTAIVNMSDFGVSGAGGGAAIQWQGSILGADVFSESLISADIDPDMMVQVWARKRSSDNARYGFHYNLESGIDEWQIKYDGVPTAQTATLVANPDPPALAAGDTIRIEAVGNVIRGLVKCATCDAFVEVVSYTDTRPEAILDGPVGTTSRARLNPAPSVTYPTPVVESWCGGNIIR